MSPRGESDRLFAYGTLMFHEIFRAVTRHETTFTPARLAGFARFKVRGESFPALKRLPGGRVDGVVSTPLDQPTWRRLDEFESDFYQRCEVWVSTSTGKVRALTYVATSASEAALEQHDWSADEFRRRHLNRYMLELEAHNG